MLTEIVERFAKQNKDNFTLTEVKDILNLYYNKVEKKIDTDYKFLKTIWYYSYKKVDKKDIFKTVILRIQKDSISDLRKDLNVDSRQLFNHFDNNSSLSSEETEFDLSGCPSYSQDKNDIYNINPSIKIIFSNIEEYNDFRSKLYNIKITEKTRTVWYPNRPYTNDNKGKQWVSEDIKNRYPIYIPSYKRADKMLTVNSLLALKIDNFFVVIKPDKEEVEDYTEKMKELKILDKLLIVPKSFIDNENKNGNFNSIPQRNYAYQHSIDNKCSHHWCLDDNIKNFYRREQGEILPIVGTSYPFVFVEKFLERYKNVYLASMQYNHLVPANGKRAIIIKNSKVYSCILIKNDNNIFWTGRYNEDIVLSLDTLSAGKSTLTFQNFLCGKLSTGSTKGGNSEIYSGDGQTQKVEELISIYPEYTKKIFKYGHDHHCVDYSAFKNNDLGYIKDINIELPKLILK